MALRVFYEDKHLAVVEKPAGVLVHPTPGSKEHTFIDELHEYFSDNALPTVTDPTPRLVHRLDRGTSGLMIIARTPSAAYRIIKSFRERSVRKGYIALVFGEAPENFTVTVPLGKISERPARYGVDYEHGLQAETIFETAWSSEDFSLLKVKPITGRTNQIRIHCAWQGFPIVGDPWHKGDYVPITPWQRYLHKNATRLCLHAYHIEFEHPFFGSSMRFWCPLPEAFIDIVRSVTASPLTI